MVAESCEVGPVAVEYLVRAARVTDIDRVVALSDASMQMARGESPLGAADLMRQLVYLPQASIVVAEMRRLVVGGAILALRPSVRAGGYVGTIDLLVVDPEYDADRITEALLEELVRSASNKGCTVVEAERPDGADVLADDLVVAPAQEIVEVALVLVVRGEARISVGAHEVAPGRSRLEERDVIDVHAGGLGRIEDVRHVHEDGDVLAHAGLLCAAMASLRMMRSSHRSDRSRAR